MTELINQMEKLIPVAGFILDITFLYILVHFLCFNYRMGIEYRIICLAGNIMSLLCGLLIARLIGYVLCQTNLFATIQGFLMNSFHFLAGASAIMTKRILYLLSYIIGVVLIRMAVMAAFTSKHLTDRIRLKRLLDHILGGIYGVFQVLFFAWLALYFCDVLSAIPSVNMSLRMIQASKILSILESHNPFRIFL